MSKKNKNLKMFDERLDSFLDFYTKDGKHFCKVYETPMPNAWSIQDEKSLTFCTFQELVHIIVNKVMEWDTYWAHDMYDDVSTPQKATLKQLFTEVL